jgi:N-acetylmuramoyl-L-alanine amidase
MKIKEHRLDEEEAEFLSTEKNSGSYKKGLPDTIVIHYTAGATAKSAIDTFTRSALKASAHVVVDFDGSVTQFVPFDTIAWHAGKSSWEDRVGLNKYSIGIEIVNAGRLEKSGSEYVSWFGKSYQENEVLQAVHRNEKEPACWHRYTEEQIATVYQLCSDLIEAYNIKYIFGHEEISPGRKIDPGPAFPLDKLRERLLHGDRSDSNEEDETLSCKNPGYVTASMLNIRSGPSADKATIANPLSRNTTVDILDEQNGWYQVDVKMRGWVSKKYIKKNNMR